MIVLFLIAYNNPRDNIYNYLKKNEIFYSKLYWTSFLN